MFRFESKEEFLRGGSGLLRTSRASWGPPPSSGPFCRTPLTVPPFPFSSVLCSWVFYVFGSFFRNPAPIGVPFLFSKNEKLMLEVLAYVMYPRYKPMHSRTSAVAFESTAPLLHAVAFEWTAPPLHEREIPTSSDFLQKHELFYPTLYS